MKGNFFMKSNGRKEWIAFSFRAKRNFVSNKSPNRVIFHKRIIIRGGGGSAILYACANIVGKEPPPPLQN